MTRRIRQTLAAIEGPFDYIVIADTIGMFEDIDEHIAAGPPIVRRRRRGSSSPTTRICGSRSSSSAKCCACKSRQPKVNYIATADFLNLMDLADFEMIRQEQRQLMPRRWFGLGPFVNRYIAPLPGIRKLCLRTYIVGASGPAVSRPEIFREHPHPLPQRARQHRKRDPAHAEIRQRPGDHLRRRQFERRHFRGMRARPRRLQGTDGTSRS